jgi:hypothetical protein
MTQRLTTDENNLKHAKKEICDEKNILPASANFAVITNLDFLQIQYWWNQNFLHQ